MRSADHVCRTFSNHVNVRHDENAWYLGKRRRIHNAKPFLASHTKVAIQNSHRVAIRPDWARAGCMMSPSLVLDKLTKITVSLVLVAGQFFDRTFRAITEEAPDKLDALNQRIK